MDKKVEIRGRSFVPSTVTVQAGSSVTWVNLDELSEHNARAIGASVPDTGNLAPGASSAPQVFPAVTDQGGIEYQCTIHPGMRGHVVVVAGTPTDPPTPAPPSDSRSDFETEEWRSIAHSVAAAWIFDMSDDIVNALERHEVSDTDERTFIRETHAYIQDEWSGVLAWWRELVGDPRAHFFDTEKSLSERQDSLMLHRRPRLEALGRKVRAARTRLAPLVERWPNPLRPDQVEAGPSGSTMFPGQSTTEFGKAITVNGLQKPLRDAYMDHQNFAGAAYGIELATDLGRPVSLDAIRAYNDRKKAMSTLHYKVLALHQYSGLKQLSRPDGASHVDAFRIHMWPFCVHGEMDAPHFSWWHWLRFIDAHLIALETGDVPDIIAPPEIAPPEEDPRT